MAERNCLAALRTGGIKPRMLILVSPKDIRPRSNGLISAPARSAPFQVLSDCATVKVDLMVMPKLRSDDAQTIFSLQNADATSGAAMIVRDNRLFLQQLGTEHSHDVGVRLGRELLVSS